MISPAFAQAAGGGAAGGGAAGPNLIVQLFPLLLIFIIIYFLILRPQRKRIDEHRKMVESVRRGDTVVTSGGIIGKVTKVYETSNEIQVEIAENVRIKVVKSTLSEVRNKTEPVPAGEPSGSKDEK